METETYRYTKISDGYAVTRKSDGKVLGSIARFKTLAPRTASATGRRTGASRTTTYIAYYAMAPGETTERARCHKRELAARHLDALDRARTRTYRKGDKINFESSKGYASRGFEIERIDGENLYVVGYRTPITRAMLRVDTPTEPLPPYAA